MAQSKASYGVILAGGRASRMGFKDKSLLQLGDKTIIEWVKETAQSQVEHLLLSVNHSVERYSFLGLDPVRDYTGSHGGPLIGIVSAMRHARAKGADENALLACFPGDAPWFPDDLIARLITQLHSEKSDVALVDEDGQLQPLFSVWSMACCNKLEAAIARGIYGPKLALPQLHSCTLSLTGNSRFFHNINTEQDLAQARELLQGS